MRFWVRDFVLIKVLEIPEYLVYCGIFKTHYQGKKSVQNPKWYFLEVPNKLLHIERKGVLSPFRFVPWKEMSF